MVGTEGIPIFRVNTAEIIFVQNLPLKTGLGISAMESIALFQGRIKEAF